MLLSGNENNASSMSGYGDIGNCDNASFTSQRSIVISYCVVSANSVSNERRRVVNLGISVTSSPLSAAFDSAKHCKSISSTICETQLEICSYIETLTPHSSNRFTTTLFSGSNAHCAASLGPTIFFRVPVAYSKQVTKVLTPAADESRAKHAPTNAPSAKHSITRFSAPSVAISPSSAKVTLSTISNIPMAKSSRQMTSSSSQSDINRAILQITFVDPTHFINFWRRSFKHARVIFTTVSMPLLHRPLPPLDNNSSKARSALPLLTIIAERVMLGNDCSSAWSK
mmetsp:Transcript_48415/g.58610  ORF Transcript_48415/g.58610 Transcript_48415/m.58610 type:complete len:284 (+) Transcript_48415:528-1379(+)